MDRTNSANSKEKRLNYANFVTLHFFRELG